MKIAISGLGGVGGYYGAMLCRYIKTANLPHQVYFIARGEHLEVIRREGLRVLTPTRDFVVHPDGLSDSLSDFPKMDLLLIATKSYDLASNIHQLLPIMGEQTSILPLLNGADISEQIRQIVPHSLEVWQGCTYISARKKAAGQILLEADKERFIFGSDGAGQSDKEKEIAQLLLDSGINVYNPEDIGQEIRRKFVMISATATGTSYFDMFMGDALREHPLQMRQLIEEVCAMYEAMGQSLGADAVERAIERQRFMPEDSTSSMHIDFIKGNDTELENLTGYVVRQSDRLGFPAPLYHKMYQALKERS